MSPEPFQYISPWPTVKYATRVPDELLESLKDAADTAAELDARMERLHRQIRGGSATQIGGGSAGRTAPVAIREITAATAHAETAADAAPLRGEDAEVRPV